jgi:hypothetical protein
MSDVRIEGVTVEITPAEFWQHGYRVGWSDRAAGRPHMLDDPPGDVLADVIPMRPRTDVTV